MQLTGEAQKVAVSRTQRSEDTPCSLGGLAVVVPRSWVLGPGGNRRTDVIERNMTVARRGCWPCPGGDPIKGPVTLSSGRGRCEETIRRSASHSAGGLRPHNAGWPSPRDRAGARYHAKRNSVRPCRSPGPCRDGGQQLQLVAYKQSHLASARKVMLRLPQAQPAAVTTSRANTYQLRPRALPRNCQDVAGYAATPK